MTLQDAVDSFISYRESYCSEITVNNYRANLSIFVKFVNDEKLQVEDMSPLHCSLPETFEGFC